MQAPASLLSAASSSLQLQPAFCGLFFFFPGQGWKKPGGSWPKGIFHPHWQQLLEHPCVLLLARCCPVATCCGAGTHGRGMGGCRDIQCVPTFWGRGDVRLLCGTHARTGVTVLAPQCCRGARDLCRGAHVDSVPHRSRCCPQLLCISSPRQEGKANTVAQSPLLLAPFPTGEP